MTMSIMLDSMEYQLSQCENRAILVISSFFFEVHCTVDLRGRLALNWLASQCVGLTWLVGGESKPRFLAVFRG